MPDWILALDLLLTAHIKCQYILFFKNAVEAKTVFLSEAVRQSIQMFHMILQTMIVVLDV